MSTSSLRRQVKNIVHNYSEAEIKVREATSNDPWGPSSSLMSEIADLTYNVVAFSEIMSMVWKRLNDHGKNWRHVYKAMTLMEYLIKTGSERVAQQCRENIYAVQTLKDFQYIDRDGKDQGVNVREKAKQLVTLLKDEERLREERIHALKTKEKMAQTSSASSAPSAPALGGGLHSGADAEQAWPQSSGEEDLQLQLALAMSKEEAEQTSKDPLEDAELRYALTVSQETHQKEERLRRGDDLRLQMAIEESKREKSKPEESSLMELSAVDPWGAPATGSAGPSPPPALAPASTAGPWGPADPWGAASPASPQSADPWGGAPATVAPDPWGDSSSRVNSDPWASTADPERRGSSVTGGDTGGGGSTGSPVPFDLSSLSSSLPVRKTPESFLGPNAALVDLDSLVSSKPKPKQAPPPSISSTSHNPFLQTQGPSSTGMGVTPGSTISSRGVSPTPPSASNPFGATPMASISPQPSSLSLSQLRTSPIPQNPMLGHMPPPAVGMVQPGMGMPGMGVPMVVPGMGMGMVQSSPMGMPFGGISPMGPAGNPLLMGPGGPAQPALILGGPSGVGGVMGTGGSMGGGTTGASTNPFLL
ncbi:epsin-1-like isoform X4 [Sinocyclocheilus anshuiensis]|uniref:epsin-1-like isoform X4 n=1 Tax=Sinocyclocheilus anshuiensis TaxID=1608454 RepID=UPI0007B7A2D1|nr:PREDICTED: epsin-1-like isoform X4 [Sinocyclocheilus anshuiensis]